MEKLISALLEFYIPLIVAVIYKLFYKPPDRTSRDLSKLVLYFFLPILLFNSVSGKNLLDLAGTFIIMIAASALTITVSLVSALILFKGNLEIVLPSFYVNAAYLPLPIAMSLWGEASIHLIGFYVLFNATIGNLLAPFLLGRDIKEGVKRIVRYPPLYGITLGFLCSLMGFRLPPYLAEPLYTTGSLAPPLALVVIGLQTEKTGNLLDGSVMKLSVIRFFISPLATYLALPFIVPPESLAFKVALLESFMPPAVTNVILANEFLEKSDRIVRIVLETTIISTLFIPAFLLLMK